MSTLRATLAKFWVPLAGVYLILVGIALLTGFAFPPILMGVLALVAGLCALCAS